MSNFQTTALELQLLGTVGNGANLKFMFKADECYKVRFDLDHYTKNFPESTMLNFKLTNSPALNTNINTCLDAVPSITGTIVGSESFVNLTANQISRRVVEYTFTPTQDFDYLMIYPQAVVVNNSGGFAHFTMDNFTIEQTPEADIVATPSSTCLGYDFSVANAIPGAIYTWDLGDGNSVIGNPVSHVYGTAGSYQVGVLTTLNGCTSKSSIIIDVDGSCLEGFRCPCLNGGINIGAPGVTTYISNITSNPFFYSGCVAIAGTLVIDQDMIAWSTQFTMQPGSKIVVASGKTFSPSLYSSFKGCFEMWEGIEVEPNGYLNASTILIEDAIRAISVSKFSKLTCQNNTFDKNLIGIYARSSPTVIGQLKGNSFDCTVKLKKPFENDYGNAAMFFENGVFTVGDQSGGISSNTIQGLNNGIVARNGSYYIYDVSISNLRGSILPNALPSTFSSFPISAIAGNAIIFENVRVGNVEDNQFTKVNCGIGLIKSSLTAKNNQIDAFTGVYARQCVSRNLDITNNTFTITSQLGSGINLSNNQGLNRCRIANNSFMTQGQIGVVGIKLNLSFASIPNRTFIEDNNLNFASGVSNNGMNLASSRNWMVRNNFIDGGSPFNSGGINYINCPNLTVAFNSINNCSVGVSWKSSENHNLYCNSFVNCSRSFEVDGYSGFSTVATNSFSKNGIIYLSQAVTGAQVFTGNTWDLAAGGLDAVHNNLNLSNLSQYIVPANRPLRPRLWSPTTWFNLTPGNSLFCNGETEFNENQEGKEDFAIKVFEGQLDAGYYGPTRQWLGERSLFHNLSTDVAMNGFEGLDFITYQEGGSIPVFERISLSLTDALQMDPSVSMDMDTKEAAMLTFIMSQSEHLNLIDNAAPIDSIQHYNSLEFIVHELSELDSTYAALLEHHIQQLQIKLTDISHSFTSVPTTELYEVNVQETEMALVEKLQMGSVSNSTQSILENIANQCVHEGGNAVLLARSMLQVLNPTLEYEYDYACSETDQGRIIPEIGLYAAQKMGRVFPNPAANNLQLELFDADQPFQWEILDVLGRSKQLLGNSLGNLTIDITTLSKGFFFLRIDMADGQKVTYPFIKE